VALILGFAEMTLRMCGFYPGVFYKNSQSMETFSVQHRFLADSSGMTYYDSLAWKTTDIRPVNHQGFLSNSDYTAETRNHISSLNKKCVFGIGDSFMEGVSDSGYKSTFAEIVRTDMSNLHAFWPFGVGGTDPLNYFLILKKFIGLKPDLVIVTFCTSNDVMRYDKKPVPYVPQNYLTNDNLGLISSSTAEIVGGVDSVIPTARGAYDFYISHTTLTGRTDIVSKAIMSLSITTQAWRIYNYCKNGFAQSNPNVAVTRKWLLAMDSLCARSGIPCIFVLVPSKDDPSLDAFKKEYVADLFAGLHIVIPNSFGKSDFLQNDTHFNAKGNAKFAKVIEQEILKW
jgi:hypothetical protein